MNQVYYGNLAYGIEPPRPTSKNARALTLPEAASAAGLPQAPSAYDPFNRTEVATNRRNQVLRAMLTEGYINQEQHDWAASRGLGLKAGKLYKDDPRAVLLRVRARPADRGVRRRRRCAQAGSRCTRRSIPGSSAPPRRRSRRRSTRRTTRPPAIISINPETARSAR